MAEWVLGPHCTLGRCPGCGHVVRDLATCPAAARSHPWGGNQAFDRIRLRLTRRRLERLMPPGRALDVLEVGFGRGRLLAALQAKGHRVSGVDRGALELQVSAPLKEGAQLYPVAAEQAELPERAFDLVYGIHVVEHLEDPAAVFRSWHRALRPGGRLYIMTPNAQSKGLTVFGAHWWNLEDPTHVRFFSPRSIATMLTGAGFEGVRWRTPAWDSLTLEVSSLLRALGRRPGEHGVMASRAALPLYAALTPVALAARSLWPELSPTMEVTARTPS